MLTIKDKKGKVVGVLKDNDDELEIKEIEDDKETEEEETKEQQEEVENA